MTQALLAPLGLLVLSNVFMTIAWYGHLKFTHLPVWTVVFASWGVAFFEYCLQVPANRIGYGMLTAAQLKIAQEAITITVFTVFAWLYLGETLRWNEMVSFGLIVIAVVIASLPGGR